MQQSETRSIVLIDPIKQEIIKKYTNKNEVLNQLGYEITKNNMHSLYICLSHIVNSFHNHILKYEDESTQEKIIEWSSKIKRGLNNEKKCNICKKFFEMENIKWGYCKDCYVITKNKNTETLDGFLRGILHSMEQRCKIRSENGRKEAGKCEHTLDSLIELYNKQKGKCAYSGLEMSIKPLTDYKCSAERLDNEKGYTKDNVVLVCQEFNGYGKWSREKVLSLKSLMTKEVDQQKLLELIDQAKEKRILRKRKPKKMINNIELYHCLDCNKFFEENHFQKNKKRNKIFLCPYCNECYNKHVEAYMSTLRGFILSRINSARGNTKRRGTKNRDKECTEFNITFDSILDKIKKQNGKCFISSVPLSFKPGSDWMMSIERLDNSKGYTDENTVLIAFEFNTSDNSMNAIKEVNGIAQWTKSKYNYLMENMK